MEVRDQFVTLIHLPDHLAYPDLDVGQLTLEFGNSVGAGHVSVTRSAGGEGDQAAVRSQEVDDVARLRRHRPAIDAHRLNLVGMTVEHLGVPGVGSVPLVAGDAVFAARLHGAVPLAVIP